MAYCGPCNVPAPLVCTQPCYQTEIVGATGATGPTGGAAPTSVNFTVGYRGSPLVLTAAAAPALITFAQSGTTQQAIGVGTAYWNAGSATFLAPQAGVYNFKLNVALFSAGASPAFTLYYAINDVPILSNYNFTLPAAVNTVVPLNALIAVTLNSGDRVYFLAACTGTAISVNAFALTAQSIGF